VSRYVSLPAVLEGGHLDRADVERNARVIQRLLDAWAVLEAAWSAGLAGSVHNAHRRCDRGCSDGSAPGSGSSEGHMDLLKVGRYYIDLAAVTLVEELQGGGLKIYVRGGPPNGVILDPQEAEVVRRRLTDGITEQS
jgi:hypothetical protein